MSDNVAVATEAAPTPGSGRWTRAKQAAVTSSVARGFKTLRDMSDDVMDFSKLTHVAKLGRARLFCCTAAVLVA